MNQYDELFRSVAMQDDESAFKILYYQFFTPLCIFAMRFVRNRNDCEDVVQETFLRIWINRKTIEISSSIQNFLVTSVKNACIDHLRKKETEQSFREWLLENTSDESNEDVYAVSELSQMLNRALAKLPDKIRTTFVMNRFDGKTYTETATLQNISVKTVESHMAKAIKFLRKELKDYLPPRF
jgi:RNA polymerase sigma-70 factor (ECF subfamily)